MRSTAMFCSPKSLRFSSRIRSIRSQAAFILSGRRMPFTRSSRVCCNWALTASGMPGMVSVVFMGLLLSSQSNDTLRLSSSFCSGVRRRSCILAVQLCFLHTLLSLLPFAELVQSGLLGRVGDGFGNDALQRRNPRRHGRFFGHHSLFVRKHGKRVLALQG